MPSCSSPSTLLRLALALAAAASLAACPMERMRPGTLDEDVALPDALDITPPPADAGDGGGSGSEAGLDAADAPFDAGDAAPCPGGDASECPRVGANANATCVAGRCVVACSMGYADCDGDPATGCEADLGSVTNCGTCGTVCRGATNAMPACLVGNCRVACLPGFADCDRDPATGCEIDTRAHPMNCGTCGTTCGSAPNARGACMDGTCRLVCEAGFGDCDGNAANGCETPLAANNAHCGMCGNACPASPANATVACTSGACRLTCAAGFGDCDGAAANGCEVRLATTTEHCGACGNACRPGSNGTASCVGGTCAYGCQTGYADCDRTASNGCEVQLENNTSHCGACGTACTAATNATSVCAGGACGVMCLTGYADCDRSAANGCEINTNTSEANCGACGTVCPAAPNSRPVCMGGCGIACSAGFADCDGNTANGCEVDVRANASHCGGCGNVCPAQANADPRCAGSSCAITCRPGYADCNLGASDGCEVTLASSPSHCGACGNACPSPPNTVATCTAGVCGTRCLPGYADCDMIAANGCEVDLQNSAMSCGACGRACPGATNASPTCIGGTCRTMCLGGFADCDGDATNGCEINVGNSLTNCGTCGTVCRGAPNAQPVCAGSCGIVCNANYYNCDSNTANGCERYNPAGTGCM